MHRQKEVHLPIKYVNLSESFVFLRTFCVSFLLVIVQGCWFEAVDVLKPAEPLAPQHVSPPATSFPEIAKWLFVDSPQALDIFVLQDPATTCVENYFQENIWQDFMQTQCSGCHQSGALAENTSLVFDLSDDASADTHNYSVVQAMALMQTDGESLLLLKPTAQIAHGGGEVISPDGDAALALGSLIEMMETPSSCLQNQNSQSICGDGVLG
ncbi:MAG: hypothetical protein QGI45_03325, partial [Myxococcota bacterium]|nr:hypothetical protein [Myxococcota bacterium]